MSLRLGAKEKQILKFLENGNEYTISDLAKELRHDQGNTSKRVSKLEALGKVETSKENDSKFTRKVVKLKVKRTTEGTPVKLLDEAQIEIIKLLIPRYVEKGINMFRNTHGHHFIKDLNDLAGLMGEKEVYEQLYEEGIFKEKKSNQYYLKKTT